MGNIVVVPLQSHRVAKPLQSPCKATLCNPMALQGVRRCNPYPLPLCIVALPLCILVTSSMLTKDAWGMGTVRSTVPMHISNIFDVNQRCKAKDAWGIGVKALQPINFLLTPSAKGGGMHDNPYGTVSALLRSPCIFDNYARKAQDDILTFAKLIYQLYRLLCKAQLCKSKICTCIKGVAKPLQSPCKATLCNPMALQPDGFA